jgi:hypothetical protein
MRIDWEKHGNCWTWAKVRLFTFYSGNQAQLIWGRIAFVFERIDWKPKGAV